MIHLPLFHPAVADAYGGSDRVHWSVLYIQWSSPSSRYRLSDWASVMEATSAIERAVIQLAREKAEKNWIKKLKKQVSSWLQKYASKYVHAWIIFLDLIQFLLTYTCTGIKWHTWIQKATSICTIFHAEFGVTEYCVYLSASSRVVTGRHFQVEAVLSVFFVCSNGNPGRTNVPHKFKKSLIYNIFKDKLLPS